MTSTSAEAADLTETLLSVVRQQRHLAARVLIATQEPTLAPALLELCNVTIIHRFSSPAWFKAIKSHIAGAGIEENPDTTDSSAIFHKLFVCQLERLWYFVQRPCWISQSTTTRRMRSSRVFPLPVGRILQMTRPPQTALRLRQPNRTPEMSLL